MVMLTKRLIAISAGAVLLAGSASCHKLSTIPTPTLKTDTFSGTVTKGGSSNTRFTIEYPYIATQPTVELTSLKSAATGADLGVTIGVGFG